MILLSLLWSNILHNKYSLITSPVHSFSRRNLFLARNASTEIFGQSCSWQVLHGNFRGNDRQIHHILGSKVCIHISPWEFDIPDYVILSPCYSLSVLSLINWSGLLFCYQLFCQFISVHYLKIRPSVAWCGPAQFPTVPRLLNFKRLWKLCCSWGSLRLTFVQTFTVRK